MHVVWDWNGTLIDDLDLAASVASAEACKLGFRPFTVSEWRGAMRRPIRSFYEALLGQRLSNEDYEAFGVGWHTAYDARADTCSLGPEVIVALVRVGEQGHTQSICSLLPDDLLQRAVKERELLHHFTAADGSQDGSDMHKHDHLAQHLDDLKVDESPSAMIGDVSDD